MDPQLGGGGHAPGIPELDQDPGGGALDRGRDRRHLRGRGAMLGLCPALGGGVRPPAPGAGSAGQAGDPLPAGGRREAGQVRGAGRAYLRALAALQRAPGDPLNAVYWGQGLSLATEIPLRLQQSLSAICLQALPLQTSLRQGQRAARALRVRDRKAGRYQGCRWPIGSSGALGTWNRRHPATGTGSPVPCCVGCRRRSRSNWSRSACTFWHCPA